MIAFLFPGQGSQFRGMGRELFGEVREYAGVEKDVDRILGYSLRQLCLEDSGKCLRLTQFTQPSLYVVNALHYYKAMSQGTRPAYLAGHSLGEYNALLAAGAFDFLTGLRLVQKRGELMSQQRDGGMAAVIGLSTDKILALMKENGLARLDVANFNSPSQTVLSGLARDIECAGQIFEKAGASLYIPLPVGAAFHSRYMTNAAAAFGDFLAPFSFSALRVPVVSNVTARPYPAQDGSEAIKSLLVSQIDHSVHWSQSIRWLMSQGVTQFSETGPGTVLTRILQQLQQLQEQSC